MDLRSTSSSSNKIAEPKREKVTERHRNVYGEMGEACGMNGEKQTTRGFWWGNVN
jgi:hypothetical protein